MMILTVSLLNIPRKQKISKIVANNYVPTYHEDYSKRPWYESDMMSFIDHIKYRSMRDNPDSYFNNVKVVNFDIINHECRGDKLIGPYKDFKTIKSEHLTNYPKNDAEVVLSAAFQNRDDLWVKHDFMIKRFREYFN